MQNKNRSDFNLEQLLAQRKELDELIKWVKGELPIVAGCAKFDKETYPTKKPDRYYAAVYVSADKDEPNQNCKRKRWRSIASGRNKEEVAEALPEIIHDLRALYMELKKEKGG